MIEDIKKALWSDVVHVLIDMDGTIVDKYFDEYFWLTLMPQRYSEINGISIESSKAILFARYKTQERTLNWTDVDYWSRDLGIDVVGLKEGISSLVTAVPYVEDFLRQLRDKGKKLLLFTNAHPKTIEIKMEKALLLGYFDEVVTSFDMGCPKEDIRFWQRAEDKIGFDCDKTLFIDDTLEVVMAAREYGIKYVLHMNVGFKCFSEIMGQGNEFPCGDF
ncbi:MAG: HAD-IA family hydrolase [Nitrospirae bacterium]|nr:HAD-IA family hydrolase [Nitrospirota bacterium]MBF0540993.1 HAD-IA family hydrolase [Nitrospirota bacterium]